MFPFKDRFARERYPLLTVALIALGLALWLAGVLHGGILALLLCLVALAIFGQSVEDVLGHVYYAALCLVSAAIAYALQSLFGESHAAPTLAAAGLVAAVLGAYLALRPGAKILTLLLVPYFAGVIELSAVALVALWLVLQALIGAFALDEPLAHAGASWFVHLALLPLTLLVVAFARHLHAQQPAKGVRPQPPRPPHLIA